jgi:putative phage-type endonuclease
MTKPANEFNHYIKIFENYVASFELLLEELSKSKKNVSKYLISDLKNAIEWIFKLVTIYQSDTYRAPWPKTYETAMFGITFSKTQPAQGTIEWLEQRKNRISASDIGSALDENEYKESDIVIIEKCGYPDHWWFDESSFVFTHHGHKYEFVASQIHEVKYKVKCNEAGFIPHPTIDFIGASPDKFVIDDINHRGYLVEIKCPYRRYPKPNIVPRYYWIQMQIQLEVTGLDECYFEDCRILEYSSEAEYLEDTDMVCPKKGVIGAVQDLVANTIHYIYPVLHNPETDNGSENERYLRMKNEIDISVNELKQKSEKYYFKGYSWWRLEKHESILVLRDRKWFAEVFPKLQAFWQKILYHRAHGYDELLKKYNKPTVAELLAKPKVQNTDSTKMLNDMLCF